MKTKLLLLKFLVTSLTITSQMIVKDVGAEINMNRQIVESEKQLKQMEKNYKLLQESKDKYEKVSSIIRSIYSISEVIKLQKEAIHNVGLVIKHNDLKGKYKENLLKDCTNKLANIGKHVDIIKLILKNDFFKMSDMERITMFEKEKDIIYNITSATRGMSNPYYRMNNNGL